MDAATIDRLHISAEQNQDRRHPPLRPSMTPVDAHAVVRSFFLFLSAGVRQLPSVEKEILRPSRNTWWQAPPLPRGSRQSLFSGQKHSDLSFATELTQ